MTFLRYQLLYHVFLPFLLYYSSFFPFLPLLLAPTFVNFVLAIYSLVEHCIRFTTALSHYLLLFAGFRKENFHDGDTKAVVFEAS